MAATRDQFPIDVYQTGFGHVVEHERERSARPALASEKLGKPVHPNDHVNASQSSNDVFSVRYPRRGNGRPGAGPDAFA